MITSISNVSFRGEETQKEPRETYEKKVNDLNEVEKTQNEAVTAPTPLQGTATEAQGKKLDVVA